MNDGIGKRQMWANKAMNKDTATQGSGYVSDECRSGKGAAVELKQRNNAESSGGTEKSEYSTRMNDGIRVE
jgi:hypothetical protein